MVERERDLSGVFIRSRFAIGEDAMFAGLESVQANPRRGWTALVSFTLQAAAVAAALAIPLMYPNSLQDAFAPRRIFVPITGPSPESPQSPVPSSGSHSGLYPAAHAISVTPDASFHIRESGPDVIGDAAPGFDSALFATGGGGPRLGTTAIPIPRPVAVTPIRVSRAMQSYLIHRVEPRYPEIARAARLEGAVLIKALINSEGRIEQAQVISGSPLLSGAALDAIRQWRYRPYLLNDKPVEVETEITVNFYLSR